MTISEDESFQNSILRPILKNQNGLLVAIFLNHLSKLKTNFEGLSETDRDLKIEKLITKDIALKNLMLGMVVGQIEPSQFEAYLSKKEELNRRIMTMLVKRLKSNFREVH